MKGVWLGVIRCTWPEPECQVVCYKSHTFRVQNNRTAHGSTQSERLVRNLQTIRELMLAANMPPAHVIKSNQFKMTEIVNGPCFVPNIGIDMSLNVWLHKFFAQPPVLVLAARGLNTKYFLAILKPAMAGLNHIHTGACTHSMSK